MMGRGEEKKLNWEENVPNFEDQRDGFTFSYVQVPEERVFESKFYFSAYQRFAKEHNDSMGFDVENYFPKKVGKLLSVKPVILSPSKKLFQPCRDALQTVLDYLDKKNEHSLLLVRIVKANYRSDFRFFVTFEAKTKDEGLIEVYQSVIFRHLDHDKIVLHMFTKKGAVKGAVKYDCREKYRFDSIGEVKESDFNWKYGEEIKEQKSLPVKAEVKYHCGEMNRSVKIVEKRSLDHDEIALRMFTKEGAVKGVVKYDCREKYCFDTIKGAKESDFKSKDVLIEYRKFAKEHDDSEGFDINHFPRLWSDLPMMLKPVRKFNSSVYEDCKIAVKNILEYLKTTNEHDLVLIKIIKANYRSDFRFYVTFEAKAFIEGEISEYQSVFDQRVGEINDKIALHMFRKKGAVKGAVDSDWRAGGYNFCRIGEVDESDFKSNEDFVAFQRYAKEHDDSEGFDIKHFNFPQSGVFWSILMPVRKSKTILFEKCEKAVKNVLEYLKRKDEKTLTFVRVIKANYCINYLFYVTFEAESEDSRTEKYQSVIFYCGVSGQTCLQMFRKKGEKLKEEAVHQAFDDERDEYEFREVGHCTDKDFEEFDDFCNYEKYVKEHNDSEGFDINTVIGICDGDCSATLMPVQISDTPIFRHLEKAVQIVLHNLHSMNEENLDLVRVTKANYRRPYLFFVTFKAKNKDLGKINVYQSVIFYDGRLTELNLFRKRRRRRSRLTETS